MKQITRAVPRSGCSITNAAGAPIRRSGTTSVDALLTKRGGTPWKKRARLSTTASFMNSDGWSRMMPRSIQRCAPMPVCPIASTTTSRTRNSA